MAGGLKSTVKAREGELVGRLGWESSRATDPFLILVFRQRSHSRMKIGENVVSRTRQYYNRSQQAVAPVCIPTFVQCENHR